MSLTTPTLFDSAGIPHPSLLELLERLAVPHDGTLQGIRSATQFAWLVPGKLRAHISDDDDRALLPAYQPLLESLGHVHALSVPKDYTAEYAVVGGAKRKAVEKRLAYLVTQWHDANFRFRIVTMFGSGRTLDQDELDPIRLMTNEAQMVSRSYFDAEKTLPWELERGKRFLASQFPFAPKPADRNANVEDCASAWLRQFHCLPASVVCVFSQPFVAQQTLAVRLALGPKWADVQGIGYAALPSYGLRAYLDNIAKQIDVEYRLSIS